jgi:hypothetical protein
MNIKKIVVSLLPGFAVLGCVSRAPTKCELDKRSGLYPSSYCDAEKANDTGAAQTLTAGLAPTRAAALPVREGPVIAKVWVAEQLLDGGHWMQGTWLFVEVESSRWSGEVRRVKAAQSTLGSKKSPGNASTAAFNAAQAPTKPSSSATSTRAGRGGDK